jgi:hypothetical protein
MNEVPFRAEQDIWALAECGHLQEVCLSTNPISRLGALASLHQLETLYIDGCAIKSELQLRVLSPLPNLRRLWMDGNPLVASLPPRRTRMLMLNLLPGRTPMKYSAGCFGFLAADAQSRLACKIA